MKKSMVILLIMSLLLSFSCRLEQMFEINLFAPFDPAPSLENLSNQIATFLDSEASAMDEVLVEQILKATDDESFWEDLEADPKKLESLELALDKTVIESESAVTELNSTISADQLDENGTPTYLTPEQEKKIEQVQEAAILSVTVSLKSTGADDASENFLDSILNLPALSGGETPSTDQIAFRVGVDSNDSNSSSNPLSMVFSIVNALFEREINATAFEKRLGGFAKATRGFALLGRAYRYLPKAYRERVNKRFGIVGLAKTALICKLITVGHEMLAYGFDPDAYTGTITETKKEAQDVAKGQARVLLHSIVTATDNSPENLMALITAEGNGTNNLPIMTNVQANPAISSIVSSLSSGDSSNMIGMISGAAQHILGTDIYTLFEAANLTTLIEQIAGGMGGGSNEESNEQQ